jgi:hypothetical protein
MTFYCFSRDTIAEENRCVSCPSNHIRFLLTLFKPMKCPHTFETTSWHSCRLAGDSNCIQKPQCPSKYVIEVFDECNLNENRTTKRFLPLEPSLCNISSNLPSPEVVPYSVHSLHYIFFFKEQIQNQKNEDFTIRVMCCVVLCCVVLLQVSSMSSRSVLQRNKVCRV